MSIRVRYFASLRDAAGCAEETIDYAGDLGSLYESLAARHGFSFPRARLRVAVDGAFADWDAVLADGAEVVFVPPVSGG